MSNHTDLGYRTLGGSQMITVTEWLAWDVAPLGPCWAWAVYARSSKPQDAEQPWCVAAHGVVRSLKEAKVAARIRAESVPGRLEALLLRLRHNDGKHMIRDGDGNLPSVSWWRGSRQAKEKTLGSVSVGDVEVFWAKDVERYQLADLALTALGVEGALAAYPTL